MKRRTFMQKAAIGAAGSVWGIQRAAAQKTGNPNNIRIRELTFKTENYPYRLPMKFGGRVLTDITLVVVTAAVESRSGKRALGRGAMTIGNAWAWPSASLSQAETAAAMAECGQEIIRRAGDFSEWGHPLRLGLDLGELYDAAAAETVRRLQLPEPIPHLAVLNMSSPLEAALFDAYGKLHGANAFALLGPDWLDGGLAPLLGDEFRGEWPDRYFTPLPRPRLPLYHLVGGLDPLTDSDVRERPGDGRPVTLPEWIAAEGIFCFKVKLAGNDLDADVKRFADVGRVVAGTDGPNRNSRRFSADFNEKCPDEDYVLQWLDRIERLDPTSFAALEYIEQPTPRDLNREPVITMNRAAPRVPVVIDESLTDVETFRLAMKRGYSGVALKACKGLARSILFASLAQKENRFLCVQDLTCPGEAFLASAALAAHIPTVRAIEGNARQYCPAANDPFAERFPGIFHVADGTIETALLAGNGVFG